MTGPFWMSVATLGLYVVAEGFSIAHIRRDKPAYGWATSLLLLLGFLAQFAALQWGGRVTHTVPYHDLAASMSLFAWMVVGTYGVLLLIHREVSTGPFLLPIAIVFLGASLFAHPSLPHVPNPKLTGPLFAFHVTLAILGYAALSLSFVLAQLYLIQTRRLQRKRLGVLFARMPALDVLFRLHRSSVAIGGAVLTLSTVLGLVWAKRNWGTPWDPKVVFTFLILGVYAFTLAAPRLGWSGKRTSLLSIAGFVLLLFSYTIVNLYLTAEHGFR